MSQLEKLTQRRDEIEKAIEEERKRLNSSKSEAQKQSEKRYLIEKHCSHLKVVQAINQLRGSESRLLIDAGGVVDSIYESRKVRRSVQ